MKQMGRRIVKGRARSIDMLTRNPASPDRDFWRVRDKTREIDCKARMNTSREEKKSQQKTDAGTKDNIDHFIQ